MKLKIFKIQRGPNGKLKDSPFDYLLSSFDMEGNPRAVPPIVLRGSPDLVGPLLKRIPSVTPYTSGVLGFEEPLSYLRPFLPGVMTAFENVASVPSPRRQPWVWIMHQTPSGFDSKGAPSPRVELHFVVGNIDLQTNRHSRLFFVGVFADNSIRDDFQDFINIQFNLTAPGERIRSDLESNRRWPKKSLTVADNLTRRLRAEVDSGNISDANQVLQWLGAIGTSAEHRSWRGAPYLRVVIPEQDEKGNATSRALHLRGYLWAASFDRSKPPEMWGKLRRTEKQAHRLREHLNINRQQRLKLWFGRAAKATREAWPRHPDIPFTLTRTTFFKDHEHHKSILRHPILALRNNDSNRPGSNDLGDGHPRDQSRPCPA